MILQKSFKYADLTIFCIFSNMSFILSKHFHLKDSLKISCHVAYYNIMIWLKGFY